MKQYDKIWVEEKDLSTVQQAGFFNHMPYIVRKDGDVIVLTLEEARDLFHAGVRYMEGLETSYYNGRPNFETYLQSKGIKL